MSNNSLIPANENQQEVEIYGDKVTLVYDEKGNPFVVLRTITNNLGLAWPAQRTRTNRDEAFKDRTRKLHTIAADGKRREMLCLPVQALPGWMTGIQSSRVAEHLRERLELYRRDAFDILWESAQSGRLKWGGANDIDAYLAGTTPAALAYQSAMAVAQLARQQAIIEANLSKQADAIQANLVRIEQLESKLGDDRLVSAEQATDISQAVKTIAHTLGKRSGRNEYGGVYGELYRRFGITSYKQLPAAKFAESMAFLNNWYQTLTGEDSPF